MTARNIILSTFTCIFLYAVIPACIVWCILLTILFYTYIIKGCIFLATGTISIVGATGSLAMVPAKIEAVLGLTLTIVGAGVAVLYRFFTQRPPKIETDDLSFMIPFTEMTAPIVLS